jgi:hypothetical protein
MSVVPSVGPDGSAARCGDNRSHLGQTIDPCSVMLRGGTPERRTDGRNSGAEGCYAAAVVVLLRLIFAECDRSGRRSENSNLWSCA